MTETKVTVHNESELRVQAQIFAGRALIDTCVLNPGEIHVLSAEPQRYDIFLKNGATGWEIARKLDIEFTTVSLRHEKGRYVIVGSQE
jgi:hypothetical protein